MVIALAVVAVLFVLFLLIKTPIYAIYVGILAILLAVAAAFLASTHGVSDDGAWLAAFAVIYVYIGFGCYRVYAKRKDEAAEEAEHASEQAQSAAYALGLFASRSEDLPRILRRARALASEETEIDAKTCVTQNAISLIRLVALEADEVRGADAEALRLLCEGARFWDLTALSSAQLVDLIETSTTNSIHSLSLLREAQSDEFKPLAAHFKAFVQERRGPDRAAGIAAAEEHIRAEVSGTQENIQELADEAARLLQEGQELLALDSPYAILGVEADCTPEQAKAAYRAKVQEWHPDKLESMAPELKTYANEQLARINAAYEELQTDA